ncbi:MAG: flippase-like domain-containing protein [Candidatus Omnitrophica bacterium]|nr:flippase-like domain-containing protein [Candidatus Omnitrophota bacterium]
MKKKLSVFLRITISLGLMGLLFWIMRGKIHDVWKIIYECNARFLWMALIVLLLDVAMVSFRLATVFKGEKLYMSFQRAFQLTCVGYYFNNFMPTAVGGDIVKAHYASNTSSDDKARPYMSVFMDRFIGLYTILIISAVALVLNGGKMQIPGLSGLVTGLVLIGAIGFVVITNKNVARKADRFFSKFNASRFSTAVNRLYRIVHDYRNRKKVVAKALFLSFAAQCLYFFTVYLFFLALGVKISTGSIFLIMPVVLFVGMMPSLGGLGFREGAIVVLFAPLAGKENAFTVSLLLLASLLLVSILGGVIYLWWSIKGQTREQITGR